MCIEQMYEKHTENEGREATNMSIVHGTDKTEKVSTNLTTGLTLAQVLVSSSSLPSVSSEL